MPSSGNWWAESPEAIHIPADDLLDDSGDDMGGELPDFGDDDEEP
jgi:hypothetical protein